MKLVIEDEAGTRSIVPFDGEEITVGRAPEGNTVRLPERDVSRRHARFTLAGGAVFIDDLGSLTGTRVNGERLSARRRLREGDLVEIGDYDLTVVADQVLAAVAGPGAPPPLPGAGRPPSESQRLAIFTRPVTARSGNTRPGPAPFAPTVQVAAQPAPRSAARSPGGRRRRWLLAALVAAALGLAVGYAVGALGRPAHADGGARSP